MQIFKQQKINILKDYSIRFFFKLNNANTYLTKQTEFGKIEVICILYFSNENL